MTGNGHEAGRRPSALLVTTTAMDRASSTHRTRRRRRRRRQSVYCRCCCCCCCIPGRKTSLRPPGIRPHGRPQINCCFNKKWIRRATAHMHMNPFSRSADSQRTIPKLRPDLRNILRLIVRLSQVIVTVYHRASYFFLIHF